MITLDITNCFGGRVGAHGLEPAAFAPGGDLARAAAAHSASLARTRGTGLERWRNLPLDPMRAEHLRDVVAAVEHCRGRFDTLVVLGIGGSALGNTAIQSALNPPTWNLLDNASRRGPRLFVIDNVDPDYFSAILAFCAEAPGGLRRTCFNVISKSGETAETAAQFLVVRDMLRRNLGAEYAANVVAITDPARGTMRQICAREGYRTLPVPDGVGGRFSVLSPVGLFSAAMCGIDVTALLDGAAAMDARCESPDLARNPAAALAAVLVELGRARGKTNHVLMPYSTSLYGLADWYRQLWAESLGKRESTSGAVVNAGFTPIKALGATDQHSQVQLYREGPHDKVMGLVEVTEFAHEVTIPRGMGIDALAYLEGARMGALLNAERRATEYALVESQRPTYTIRMPRIDAHHVGEFIQLWQVATAYAGLMLGVNAFDQPAVELGKQATFGLMGKQGFGEFAGKVERVCGGHRMTV